MSKRSITVLAATTIAALSVGFSAGQWFAQRPPTGWITHALVPSFHAAYLEGEPGHQSPILFFQLKNTTDQDYELRDMSAVELFAREHGVLDSSLESGFGLTIDLPVFVPAGQKAIVAIHFKVVEFDRPASDAEVDVQAFLRDPKHIWNSYESIVLFDKRTRYAIDFPMMR